MSEMRCPMFLLIASWLVQLSVTTSSAQDMNTNYFAAVNQEVDLARSLFVETNGDFDASVCSSLAIRPSESVEVRYLQISFFFFYPDSNKVGPASSEMDVPYVLVD